MRQLVDKYGYADIAAELDRRDGWPMKEEDSLTGGVPMDDYVACNITRKEDWVDLYAKPYYFGCEADDRMNAVAFGRGMPFGARINAIFSSDIGHFDVPDMLQPVPEAYELVEDGLITDLIEHWERRGAKGLAYMDPAKLNRPFYANSSTNTAMPTSPQNWTSATAGR